MVSFFVTVVFDRIPMSKDNASITFLTVLILPANVFILDGFCLASIQKRNNDSLGYSSVLIVSLGFLAFIYLLLIFATLCDVVLF